LLERSATTRPEKKGSRPSLDDEKASRAQQLSAEGKSYGQIAEELGISKASAFNLVKGLTGRS
jgi:DNA-binding CsgD family transcriptional regulator